MEMPERADGALVERESGTTQAYWRPPVLGELPAAVFRGLTYVVVDDLDGEDDSVVLTLSEWPRLDELGRVRHRLESSEEVDLPAKDFGKIARSAKGRVRRPPRVGDAFAMMLPARTVTGLAQPVGPPVDVTVDARAAARAAFYGAVSRPLVEQELPDVELHDVPEAKAVAAPSEWLAAVAEVTA